MSKEDNFLANLEAYLDLSLNDFDKTRILGYLKEYVGSLPLPPEPPPIVIYKNKITYKTVDTSERRVKNRDIVFSITPMEIIALVEDKTGVSYHDMQGRSRQGITLIARHIAMYLIRKECDRAWKAIGDLFNKDHTTVIHAYHHVADMLVTGHSWYCALMNEITPNIPQPIKQTA